MQRLAHRGDGDQADGDRTYDADRTDDGGDRADDADDADDGQAPA
jgi:hypothetical protein